MTNLTLDLSTSGLNGKAYLQPTPQIAGRPTSLGPPAADSSPNTEHSAAAASKADGADQATKGPASNPVTPRPGATLLVDESVARSLTQRAQAALAQAVLGIDSDTLLALAGEDLRAVKALQHEVEVQRTAITGPLNEALRRVNALFRAPKDYLEQAERTLKRAMVDYTSAREAAAQAAREQAEVLSLQERERLAKQASDQREEGAQSEAAARRAAQIAHAAQQAGDWTAAAAAQEQARSEFERAEAAFAGARSAEQLAQVVSVPAAVAPPQPLAGISERVNFSAEVVDLAALVQAVACGAAPAEAIQANESFLCAQARAHRHSGPLYPGVRVVAQRALAASRAL